MKTTDELFRHIFSQIFIIEYVNAKNSGEQIDTHDVMYNIVTDAYIRSKTAEKMFNRLDSESMLQRNRDDKK